MLDSIEGICYNNHTRIYLYYDKIMSWCPMRKVVDLAEYKERNINEVPTKTLPKIKKKRRFHFVQFLKFCLAITFMVVGSYFFSCLPIFNVSSIVVEGNTSVDSQKIIELSEIKEGDNLFQVSKKDSEEMIALYPYIESVHIRKKLPNKIVIDVVERQAVGVVVTSDGYIQVSQEAIMLTIQPNLGNYNLPVISGIDLTDIPSPGQVIENENINQALKIISSCDADLLNNIAELNVGQENYILAYTNQGVEIRLGDVESIEAKMKDLNDILNDIVSQKVVEKNIQYIDMRYQGAPVIKMK